MIPNRIGLKYYYFNLHRFRPFYQHACSVYLCKLIWYFLSGLTARLRSNHLFRRISWNRSPRFDMRRISTFSTSLLLGNCRHHPTQVDTSMTIRSHGPDTVWNYMVKTITRRCIPLSLVSTYWSSRTLKPDHLSVLDPHASLAFIP